MTHRRDLLDEHSVERELLKRYRQQRDQALKDLADAQARAERYEKAVIGLEAVLPDEDADSPIIAAVPAPVDRASGRTLRGEAAVAQVLREAGGSGLTPSALTAAMAHRGWAPKSENPENAVRAAANRLRKKDPHFVFIDGKYRYREEVVLSRVADNGAGDHPSLIQAAVQSQPDERTGDPPG